MGEGINTVSRGTRERGTDNLRQTIVKDDGLSNWQKKLLNEFNPKKPVYFEYRVADVEHWGDVNNDERVVSDYVSKYGGKVTDTYWDGEDQGEAWVEAEIPYKQLKKVWKDKFFDSSPFQK